jgi:hypothetical protein
MDRLHINPPSCFLWEETMKNHRFELLQIQGRFRRYTKRSWCFVGNTVGVAPSEKEADQGMAPTSRAVL